MDEKKTYIVKIIHEFEVEAENEEEAADIAIDKSYGEAKDCRIETEEA